MKKSLIAILGLALLVSACQKQETPPSDSTANSANTPTQSTPAQDNHHHAHDGHDHHHSHSPDKAHDHYHEHHNHDHSHAPDGASAYQCGDKTVHIAIHDHEGEMEAHLTADNITYDLAPDVQSKNRYTSDDGIEGDKGMALTLDGDKAKISTLDDKVLLDCTKAS